MNAWSKLPNAKHIDWVLESIRSNHDIWIQAWIQASEQASEQAWDQAYVQARNQASGLARLHVWKQAREQAYEQASEQARNQARFQIFVQANYQARKQVSGVLLALVAYDDCEKYLSMTYNELKTWAVLTENPQAILLLPMKWIQENECLV